MKHTISNTKPKYKTCQLCHNEIWNKTRTILFEKKCECNLHYHDACFLTWINEFDTCFKCVSKVNVIYK